MIRLMNIIQQIKDKTRFSTNEIWIQAMIKVAYKNFELATIAREEEK